MRVETDSGRPRRTTSALVLSAFLSMGLPPSAFGAEPGPGALTSKEAARRAVVIAAPILSAEIVAALQEGRFADSEALLQKVLAGAKNAEDRGYDALILGIAQRLGGKPDAARTTLREALVDAPKGPWAAKLRLELAGIELAAGRVGEAEALARTQAEVLLAGDRKDRLAEVYHAFARRLLKPDNPITPADPKAAYDLLAQARSLAKGETLRARLLFAMATTAQAGNDHARAVLEFQKYLADYPKGIDRLETRYQLGVSQRAVGQVLPARFTWSDLARELEDPRIASKEIEDVRARAMFAIPLTYGIPNPPDDTALNLGVASLRRFLAAYPAHPLAVKAAAQIGTSYLNRGKSEEALAAFTSFLKEEGFRAESDEAKRDFSQLAMTATFQVGQVLQGQQKFDESIAAWKGYLAKYPNGRQSADAQRAIVDTQLLIAAEHLARERYDEARAAWQAFVSQNPLDPRVPAVLFQVGESFQTEKKFDRAVTAWEPLLSKFPNSEPAAHAQFAIAAIEETEKGELESAIDRFRKIAIDPWKSQAGQRIAVMEARALTVVTPRTFRSGETPHLKVMTRNLEKLTFSAYKLNTEAYFRKKHAIGNVESLDIGLVAPDAEWTIEVKGNARYKPIETTYDLAKIEVPGVYVVKVTDEKHLQATTLVVGSDIDAIVKTSRDQILVFAQDMKTGNGRANARVLVAQGEEVILEGKTGEDGVFLKSWDKPRDLGSGLAYLVLDGANVAGSGLAVPSIVARGLSPRAYIYADRPAYRPGQEVALRGIVREIKEGQYLNTPKAVYRLEVTDSRGRLFVARPVTLSEFGTFHEHLALDSGAPVGTYRVRLYQPGKSDFAGQFEVQAYQLQKTDLSFDLEKTVYFRGETVKADLIAKYQYGAPAAGRQIVVRLPDGRIVRGLTDASGKFHVEFPTEGFAQETVLSLVAQLPQDGVATAARVSLAIRAFETTVKTTRDVYLDGESFQVNIATFDPQGKPTGQKLSAALIKVVTQTNRTTEREVTRKAVTTDPKTGTASVSLKADDEAGGEFIVRVAGTDRFGNPVVTDRSLIISGKKDDTKLRLLADRVNYKVGEEASVNLHSRGRAGAALLTWEADRILTYKIVKLAEGDNPVGWVVDGPQFPNFTLTAARMAGSDFDEARLDLRVERDLRVTISPIKPSVEPGGDVTVEVTTVDQLGRPVAAEISLAMVDRSLLQQFADKMAVIGTFFYDQTRTGAFATASTNTFAYAPTTTAVSEAVVEEAERSAAILANLGERGDVLNKAKGQVQFGMEARLVPPAPSAAPAADASNAAVAGKPESAAAGMGGMMYRQAATRESRDMVESVETLSDVDASAIMDAELDSKSSKYALSLKDLSKKRSELSLGRSAGLGWAYGGGRDKWGENQAADGVQRPRERFVETAYWNPSIVTGSDGKARVTFKAPTALSQYEFSARGVTGADTLVGQTTASLTVRKDFFVDLKAPGALTRGDKPRFIGQVHHLGLKGTIHARMTAYAGGREQVYPKTLDVKTDGVEEIFFDLFEIPDGENVRLTFSATLGDAKDELVIEIPIRPWGVQAFASASGTSTNDTTVFVGLPPGRTYENPEMLVMVSPTLQRLLIELALGRDYFMMRGNFDVGLNPSKNATASARLESCIFPPPPNTVADRASDLMAAASALNYLKTSRGASAAPEAVRLTDTVRGLVSELTSLQNDDGGWPWVGGTLTPGRPARPSDRTTSGRVVWALAMAEPLGLITDAKTLDKAVVYLTQEFAKVGAADHETRVMLLHALSTRGKANFETANSLNRLRQSLSDSALAYLALTFVNLERVALAGEILDILAPRGKTEIATPGGKTRRFWGGTGRSPSGGSPVETTALVALGFAKARPQAAELEGAVEWLLAHREGFGFNPHKAKGPALAALSAFHGRANAAEDRFDLIVSVNETEVYRTRIVGSAEGHAILIPRDALKGADRNRIRFDIEGRGTFGYSVTMTGFSRDFKPDQTYENRAFLVTQHIFQPAPAELDGKSLPAGFNVAVGATYFENWAHQVEHGGKVRVRLDTHRVYHAGQQPWERDFLILEDHLPAGGMLVEGTVQTSASHYEEVDGRIRFYFAPDQEPGTTSYDVHGYLPGAYRTLPPILSSAYDPGKRHMATAGVYDLRILAPGEAKTDPYKATPDELHARGKAHYDAGRLAEAALPLEELFNAYTLRDDIAKDSARMLLLIHIKEYNPRKVVQYFEVVKEKAAELVISFDDLLVIGRAYRDINEYERAYIVWRGVVEASYLEDARVGEVLRQRGKTLEGIAYLLDLWREYPNTASIESDFFAISQVLASHAEKAFTDAGLRRELADAGVTRSELILQSIRLTQGFLGQSPKNPLADEASLALVGNFLELEDYPAVVKLAARFAKLYPKSTFLDSFQYSEALGEFHLGHYDRAVDVAETIAKATYKDAAGVDQPSPNKWQAVYILGQIFDARRQPAKALEYYRQVADRFTDAAEAVTTYTRKDLKLSEVTVARPPAPPKVVQGGIPAGAVFRNVGIAKGEDEPEPRFPEALKLGFRNIAEVDLKVYPVDLMRLYLTRRNLDQISGIDLAGITPLVEKTIKLGTGEDYTDKLRKIDLGLTKEGAYLVMIRGENLYTSGILLVSPLELEVLEEAGAGRVRVTVRDALSREFVPKVQVKVIGSGNANFISGETDLRGVFLAEGVTGQAAVVARKGTLQYAFYRGTTALAPPIPIPAINAPGKPDQAQTAPSLEQNLRQLNYGTQMRNSIRLQERYKASDPAAKGGAAAGGFK